MMVRVAPMRMPSSGEIGRSPSEAINGVSFVKTYRGMPKRKSI